MNFKLLELNPSIPMVENILCPADSKPLKTLCTLIGSENQIRIGFCQSCGYVGYIDRPQKEWISNFYLSTWDQAEKKDVEKETARIKKDLGTAGRSQSLGKLDVLNTKFNFSKNKFALDLGCGYGKQLKTLERLGFEKLVGVENSSHRAAVARRAWGFPVTTAPFESREAQTELKKLSPFGLIHSKHVLEHTYNPEEVVRTIAGLQTEGDYLALSLPDVLGEVSLNVLLFLPHLHSFSRQSIETLLNGAGYQIVDDSFSTKAEHYLLARRTFKKIAPKSTNTDFRQILLNKFENSLGLGREYHYQNRLLFGRRKKDIGGQVNGHPLSQIYFNFRTRNQKLLALSVEKLEKRFTDFRESPLEIHFSGNVMFYFK